MINIIRHDNKIRCQNMGYHGVMFPNRRIPRSQTQFGNAFYDALRHSFIKIARVA